MHQKKLLIVTGPSLHGKTTVAKQMSEQTGHPTLDVDSLRTEHFPTILEQGGVFGPDGKFNLPADAEVTTACYQLAVQQIADLFTQAPAVIFSGAMSRMKMREPILHWTQATPDVRLVVVKIAGTLSDEEVMRRIEKRIQEGSNSPVRELSVYHNIRLSQEAWDQSGASYAYQEIDVAGMPQSISIQITKYL